jgi:hypothetical protein
MPIVQAKSTTDAQREDSYDDAPMPDWTATCDHRADAGSIGLGRTS